MKTFYETATHMLQYACEQKPMILSKAIALVKSELFTFLDPRVFPYESEPHNVYMVSKFGSQGEPHTLTALCNIVSLLIDHTAEMFDVSKEKMLETMNATYVNKNHDYGCLWEKEIYENGIFPLFLRLNEKIGRVENLSKSEPKVSDEKIKDTLLDICNYCVITYMAICKS